MRRGQVQPTIARVVVRGQHRPIGRQVAGEEVGLLLQDSGPRLLPALLG
jgi:hypothetical protein